MKTCCFFLIVTIIACSVGCGTENQKGYSNLFPRDTVIDVNYEVFNVCSTFYYNAKDTTLPGFSRVIYYDKNGKEKHIAYHSFESYVPATILRMYDKDGRETAQYYRQEDEHTDKKHLSFTKRIFHYDENGRVIREMELGFMRRLKEGVVRGEGTPGGCLVQDEDYEKNRSWMLKTVWEYFYDNDGRLIQKFRPYPKEDYQGKYLYKYDKQGRLMEESSISSGHLFYMNKYLYRDSGYTYTSTIYEEDGTIAKDGSGREALTTYNYKVDRFNNILEERVIDAGGPVSRDRNYYDKNNRLIRKEIYNDRDSLLGFYIHQYTTPDKPRQLNFYFSNQ